MKLIKPKCIIFDWDNTLVDTWPKISVALNTAYKHFGKPELSINEVKANSHKSLKDAFPALFGSDWEKARDMYYEAYFADKNLDSLEGAKEILDALKSSSITAGIVSNKRGDMLRDEVARMGWNHYFSVILGSLDTPKDKPQPEPVYHLLEKIGLQPSEEVWFIGDTTVDIECAINSGCTPILYGDKSSSPDLEYKKFKYIHVANHQEFKKLVLKTFI